MQAPKQTRDSFPVLHSAVLEIATRFCFGMQTVSWVRLCQMQLCFLANLEPTRMRWESGQVSLTSLKTRKASVQECNGVESVYK